MNPRPGGEGAPHQSGPRGWPLGEAPEGGTPEVPPMPNDLAAPAGAGVHS